MADNIDITAGTGTTVSTNDESGAHVQRFHQTQEIIRVAQTPTISAGSIYAAKDVIGGLLTFANAARWSTGSGRVVSIQVVDADQERADIDLILFSAAPTVASDNSPFDPTDAELATCQGWVPIGGGFYSDFTDNSVAHVECNVPYRCDATSLFGVLVARSTPTYTATSDITVTVTLALD